MSIVRLSVDLIRTLASCELKLLGYLVAGNINIVVIARPQLFN